MVVLAFGTRDFLGKFVEIENRYSIFDKFAVVENAARCQGTLRKEEAARQTDHHSRLRIEKWSSYQGVLGVKSLPFQDLDLGNYQSEPGLRRTEM